MINFKQARDSAFEIVENTRKINKVTAEIKNKIGGKTINELWRVTVEVPEKEHIKEFILEVSLKRDFPLSLPVIKLNEKDYNETKYLPHVDTDRVICIYDLEVIKQNIDDPAGIVNECINQAVRIITDGINNDRSVEFNDEIIAYWENSYHKNDTVAPAYLGSNMTALLPGKVISYYLTKPHSNVNLYIGNKKNETERLIEYFKLSDHNPTSLEAFYLGAINGLTPPFYFNNKTLLTFIKINFKELWNDFKTYLNHNNSLSKFIFFSVELGDKSIFFGFYLPQFKNKHNGWRAGQTTVQIMANIIPNGAVIRIRFSEFHPDRLQARTAGKQKSLITKKIMIAGLGSIGSNLLSCLCSLDISKYILVDPEILALENINRHLLSFNEVGMKKVDAIEKFIKSNNPFSQILKHDGSIVDLIQNRLSEINELDMIFCAIGKDAIEAYILQRLSMSDIQKPVLLFWVEPYILGAHILYIIPGTSFALTDIEVEGFYKYNVIAKETYKDPNKKLALRESGCQGSYMPYGKSEILLFFSLFTPHLMNIIETAPANNLAITYVGNLNTATELHIPISEFANSLKSNQIFIQTL